MNIKSELTPRLKFVLLLIGVVALIRLLPHEFNFTPLGAIALFAGTYIANKRLAFLLPLATLFISDLLLQLFYGTGFYQDMIFVYGSFALIVGLGFVLRGREKGSTIIAASLISSVLFFLITNFGTWVMYDLYPKTLSGLTGSYMAGIPFFRGTVTGDLIYNLILFGAFALAKLKFPVLAKA